MSRRFEHAPVMVDEVVAYLSAGPAGLVVDATVGGAGHAEAILRAMPGARLLGLDRDADAVSAATKRLAAFGERAKVRKARFDMIREVVVSEEGEDARLAGVIFDLGVSSYQLDEPGRGFSYRTEAPLDMRMDRSEGSTAGEVVNTIAEEDLARLLADNGEGRFARRIARALVVGRPFSTTTQLAETVRNSIPAAARARGGHPAKRVFQALRIEVNSELDVLGPAVDAAIELLAPGARCVVLSYHSGEDRLVKTHFAFAGSGGCTCPPGLPCVCGATPTGRVLTKGAVKPSAAEVAANPRSGSARLRALEKI